MLLSNAARARTASTETRTYGKCTLGAKNVAVRPTALYAAAPQQSVTGERCSHYGGVRPRSGAHGLSSRTSPVPRHVEHSIMICSGTAGPGELSRFGTFPVPPQSGQGIVLGSSFIPAVVRIRSPILSQIVQAATTTISVLQQPCASNR
jgi:hypothetical protein